MYDRLLLSRQQFESFFLEKEIADIKENLEKDDIIKAYQSALKVRERIANKMCLDESFVVRRIAEIISSYFKGSPPKKGI